MVACTPKPGNLVHLLQLGFSVTLIVKHAVRLLVFKELCFYDAVNGKNALWAHRICLLQYID